MIIVIDGLDGVGKTSVIETLAKDEGWINLADEVKEMRQHVRTAPDHSPSVNRMLNLAFLKHMSDKASKLSKEGKTVILDRYTPSHGAYAKEFNKKAIKAGEFPDIEFKQLNLIKPDMVIILKVREDVRAARLFARDKQAPHELVLSKEHAIRKNIQKRLEKDADIIIDTSDRSAAETARLIKIEIAAFLQTSKNIKNPNKPKEP